MIPETENPQEANSVCLGKPPRHAYADPGRYFTQSPQCCFSHGTAQITHSFIFSRGNGQREVNRIGLLGRQFCPGNFR